MCLMVRCRRINHADQYNFLFPFICNCQSAVPIRVMQIFRIPSWIFLSWVYFRLGLFRIVIRQYSPKFRILVGNYPRDRHRNGSFSQPVCPILKLRNHVCVISLNYSEKEQSLAYMMQMLNQHYSPCFWQVLLKNVPRESSLAVEDPRPVGGVRLIFGNKVDNDTKPWSDNDHSHRELVNQIL